MRAAVCPQLSGAPREPWAVISQTSNLLRNHAVKCRRSAWKHGTFQKASMMSAMRGSIPQSDRRSNSEYSNSDARRKMTSSMTSEARGRTTRCFGATRAASRSDLGRS